MMKNTIKAAVVAAIITGFPISASSTSASTAAEEIGVVSQVSGNVLVKRKGEFLLAENGSGVMSGDEIFTAPGASAILDKGDCEITLPESAQFSVLPETRCEAVLMAQVPQQQPTPASAPKPLPSAINIPAAPQASTLLIIGGVAASATIVAIAVSGGDDTPASP